VKYISICSGIEAATVAWHGLPMKGRVASVPCMACMACMAWLGWRIHNATKADNQ